MGTDTVNELDRAQIARVARIAGITAPKQTRRDPASWVGENAAIYCRISRVTDEDQTGVERQERMCRDVAERLKLQVASGHAFIDNNRSAWKRDRKRPGWDELMDAIRRGEVSHVIAYHPDRLMRQPADLEELLRLADENRVTLHGQAGGRDLSDPDDRFILRMEVAHACRSSDDTSRRVKDKLTERASAGRPHTGKRRFGYDKTGTKIIESEAETVRWVYVQYLKGKTVHWIKTQLNEQNIPTALGRRWQHQTVLSLLDCHHMAGLRVFRGQEIGPGNWPAIIPVGMFREVQERRGYRAAAGRAKAEANRSGKFYTLRSLVWCTACGVRMAGGTNKGRPTYQCNNERDGKACRRRISAAVLEPFAADAAIRMLTHLDVTGREAAAVLGSEEADTIAADQEQLTEAARMWARKEISKAEYDVMRKEISERIKTAQRKAIVRPTIEVLEGMTGPGAEEAWRKLEKQGDYERINGLFRFLFAAVRIDASSTRGRALDFSRIDIEPNPAD
jgi:DNA invertase Pin-like site-specific DNA recombinase